MFLNSCYPLKKHLLLTTTRKSVPDTLALPPDWLKLDTAYRFEIETGLIWKKINLKGQLMVTQSHHKLIVQFYSDFGKNLLLMSKEKEGNWQVEYVLPEMNYSGLVYWIQEDFSIIFENFEEDISSIYASDQKYEWYKQLNTARSVVYLQANLSSPPDRAYLLNTKDKIIKTYQSNGSELQIEYKKPSLSFKFSELYVAE